MKIQQAILQKRLVLVTDQEGRKRTLEPYAIFDGKKEPLLHCYQRDGYSSQGRAEGWKNLPISKLVTIVMLKTNYQPRPEFKGK